MSKQRSTSNVEPKLAGQHRSIEQALDHGEGTIWDIVTGATADPNAGTVNCKVEKSTNARLTRNTGKAYKELEAKYKGKTVTGLGATLANVALRTERRKKNNSISKGWRGLNLTESECFPKKRGQVKRKINKAKAKDKCSGEDGEQRITIMNIKVQIQGAGISEAEKAGHFKYDTGASHHTTNRYDLLKDIQQVNLPVIAHDGTTSHCKQIGTLVFNHNGRDIEHKDCLYDSSYSNIISGQQINNNGKNTLKFNGDNAILRQERKIVYRMDKDSSGGLWIKPKGAGTGDEITTLYKMNYGDDASSTRVVDNWQGICKIITQPNSRRQRATKGTNKKAAVNHRMAALHCNYDEIRDLDICQPTGGTGIIPINNQHGGYAGAITIIRLDSQRRDYLANARKSQPSNIRTRGRTGKVTKRGNDDTAQMAHRAVQRDAQRKNIGAQRESIGATRESIGAKRESIDAWRETIGAQRETIDARRESIGAKRETIDARRGSIGATRESIGAKRETIDAWRENIGTKRETIDARREAIDGQQGGIQPLTGTQIPPPIPSYRTAIPPSPPASSIGTPNYTNDSDGQQGSIQPFIDAQIPPPSPYRIPMAPSPPASLTGTLDHTGDPWEGEWPLPNQAYSPDDMRLVEFLDEMGGWDWDMGNVDG